MQEPFALRVACPLLIRGAHFWGQTGNTGLCPEPIPDRAAEPSPAGREGGVSPGLCLLAPGDGCHRALYIYKSKQSSAALTASEISIYLAARPEPELPFTLAAILLRRRQPGLLLFLIECFQTTASDRRVICDVSGFLPFLL